jgi:hypothetical protein
MGHFPSFLVPACVVQCAVLCTGSIGTRLPQLGAVEQPMVAVQ